MNQSSPEHSRPLYPVPKEAMEAFESDTDGLHDVWDMVSGYYGTEPGEEWYRTAGANIRQKLNTALATSAGEAVSRPRPALRLIGMSWKASFAVAACITVLIAVGIVLANQPTNLTVPYGGQLSHELPDGSMLQLNSGSKLHYAAGYGKHDREVHLVRGEVFFDVTESEKPFRVITPRSEVTVLGTSFNVRFWPSEDYINVTVETGTVELASRGEDASGKTLVLHAGESGHLSSNDPVTLTLDGANADLALSWTTGAFKYEDHPFGDVIDELERRYDVGITLDPQLTEKRIGIIKENPANVEEIIRDICESNGCQYRRESGDYVIAVGE